MVDTPSQNMVDTPSQNVVDTPSQNVADTAIMVINQEKAQTNVEVVDLTGCEISEDSSVEILETKKVEHRRTLEPLPPGNHNNIWQDRQTQVVRKIRCPKYEKVFSSIKIMRFHNCNQIEKSKSLVDYSSSDSKYIIVFVKYVDISHSKETRDRIEKSKKLPVIQVQKNYQLKTKT